MAISYEKFRIKMVKEKLKLKDIHAATGISWGALSKLNNDEYVNLSTLEKICEYFECDIGDLVEIIKKDQE